MLGLQDFLLEKKGDTIYFPSVIHEYPIPNKFLQSACRSRRQKAGNALELCRDENKSIEDPDPPGSTSFRSRSISRNLDPDSKKNYDKFI